MEASNTIITEKIPASKKLQASDSELLLKAVTRLIVLKGKKISEFDLAGEIPAEALAATLGPTGNMRAPTLKLGKTLIVGFNEEIYQREIG